VRPRFPRLLRDNSNFRRFYLGQAVSLLGDQISAIALPLTAVLALHATAGQMGLLTSAYLIPNLLLSLHVGVWIDRRSHRRRTMILSDVGRAALTASIPIAYLLGDVTWGQLYVVAFLAGSLSVVFYLAYGSVFQAIVPRDDYIPANQLLHGTRGASFFVGNSVGGVLVQLISGPAALALDAASFLWSAAFIGRTRFAEPPALERSESGIAFGARWIRKNPIIRSELLGIATINFFNYMYSALVVLFAIRTLHLQPATLGIVLGTAAVGTIGSSVFTGRIARRLGLGPAFIVGCAVFTAPLILVPAAHGPHWVVVGMLFTAELLSGIGLMVLDIVAGTINASTIPTVARARVSGAFMFVNNGVRPAGAALGGALGVVLGVRPTLWLATVAALAGVVLMLPTPLRHLKVAPDVEADAVTTEDEGSASALESDAAS
jgi:MFS family permease